MHIYTCEHCKAPIERHQPTRVVTDENGLHFFHVTPDCSAAYKHMKDREAFDEAVRVQREWNEDHNVAWYTRHNKGG